MTELIPAAFASRAVEFPAAGHRDGDDWVATLPTVLSEVIQGWELTVTGATMWGRTALVLPVRGADGPAMLKLGFPSAESDTEHLALRLWSGHGAVRLLRADPHRGALLLESLDPRDLSSVPIDEACTVLGELLTRLRIAPTPALHRLSDRAAVIADSLAARPEVIPRRLVDQARELLRELARAADLDDVLVHGDLHYGNVLASTRLPWLAIDPEPLAGEQAYDVAPCLWKRPAELGTGTDVRRRLRRRIAIVCERGAIDEGRARAWAIVRSVVEAQRLPENPDRDRSISVFVAICKAMND